MHGTCRTREPIPDDVPFEMVDDDLGADNSVRFINPFVDEFDLEKAGFDQMMAKPTDGPGSSSGQSAEILH